MTSNSTRVSEQIKNGILSGRFGADQFIRESAVADWLQVSRTPVREAFRELASEGWLEIKPNRGAKVISWNYQSDREVFELRLALEPMAIELASQSISDEKLLQLYTLAEEIEALVCDIRGGFDGYSDLARLNTRFHRELVHESRHKALISSFDTLVRSSLVRRNFSDYTDDDLERSVRHHREILDAMKARQAEWAGCAMKVHMHAALNIRQRANQDSID